MLDHAGHHGRQFIGQQIGDPQHGARTFARGKHLVRRVVVREASADHGPAHAHELVVDINDALFGLHATSKRDHPVFAVKRAIGNKARRDLGMQLAHVAKRRPYLRCWRGNVNFSVNGCHAGFLDGWVAPSFDDPVLPRPPFSDTSIHTHAHACNRARVKAPQTAQPAGCAGLGTNCAGS